MNSGIYKITNIVNGKFYIGSAHDFDRRFDEHRQYLNGNYHVNPKLQHSCNYHGGDKFTFDILERCPNDQLFIREQWYLDTFKPYMREIGYNIAMHAQGGDNITHHPNRDAFVQKMREITKGENNGMFGQKHTEEAIKLQKEKAKGRFTLEWFIDRHGEEVGKQKYEERRIMLANRKINYSYANTMKGKQRIPFSEEHKKKISESKIRLRELKPFLITDIKSGKFTLLEMANKYGLALETVKYHKRKLKSTFEM